MSLDRTIKSITFDAHMDKFLLFGDSITSRSFNYDEGKTFLFGPAISELYNRRLSVVHRGFSGYNSEMARYILPKIIEAEHNDEDGKSKIRIATVFFGANDSVSEKHEQYVSLERFEENTRYMTELLLKIGSKVVLVGPAPHDENKRDKLFPGNPDLNPRRTARNLEYSQVVEKVAKDMDVGFVDLYHGFLESVGWKEGEPVPGSLGVLETVTSAQGIDHLLNDGLHFTGEGYRVFYNLLLDVIGKKYPELIPANLPFLYPEWGSVDLEEFKKL